MEESDLEKFLETAVENKFWVSFIGKESKGNCEGLGSRQVFYFSGFSG